MILDRPPSTAAGYRRAVLGLGRHRPSMLGDAVLQVAKVGTDPDALAEYDRVCGFRLSGQLPVTYPHVLAFPLAMHLMSAPDFPFGVIGLIHIANTITAVRPIAAGEPLDFEVRAADLRPHDRGLQFDIIVSASANGTPVWHGTSTYLHRSPGTPGGHAEVTSHPAANPTAVWRIGRRVGRDYARVSGDRNPIHTSRLGAKAFGFPGPIAQGMWTVARCMASLEGTLPEAYTVGVVFKRPIPLPSTVAFTANGPDLTVTDARTGTPHLAAHLTFPG